MNKNFVTTIFKAIAVAMGSTVVAMSAIGAVVSTTADMLLGISLAALGLNHSKKRRNNL
jgi:hypothetical protein